MERRSQVVCKADRKQLIYLSVEINLHNCQSFPFNIHQSWGPKLMEESLTECEQEFLLDFLRKLGSETMAETGATEPPNIFLK